MNCSLMKPILAFLFLIALTSCSTEKYQNEIAELKVLNDSLNAELNNYKSKYVFDKVYVKHYPARNTVAKIGQIYKGEFVFVPVMEETELKFSYHNKNIDLTDDSVQEITILPKKDNIVAFEFELKIETDTTYLYFEPQISNEELLKHKNGSFDRTKFVDIIITQ